MKTRVVIMAWTTGIIALLFWSGYGLLVWQLGVMRERLATREAEYAARDERDRTAGQLQTLIRDTREERSALEGLTRTDALAAAATIEAAGKRAGIVVSIGGAVSAPLQGTQSEDLRAVTLLANTQGEFAALMKAALLFESLPFPSRVESYELNILPPEKEKSRKNMWRMTTRIRVLIPSENS